MFAKKNQKIFNEMLKEHEDIISNVISEKPIQKTLFNDFYGQIKSLGVGVEILYLYPETVKRQNIF